MKLNGRAKVDIFKKVFIEKNDEQKVLCDPQKNYDAKLNEFKTFLDPFHDYENIASGLPEIY